MNSINNRLLEMKLRLECACSDTAVVSAVWSSIEALDFGGLDAACLQSYFRCLDSADQMEWIKYGGSQQAPECQRDVLAQQEACFKMELVKRMDTEDLEVETAIHTNREGDMVSYVKSTTEIDYVEIDGVLHQDERVISKVVTAQVGGNVVTERRVKSAFDVAMSEKFGSDWDAQLQNPRGSQSSGTLKVFDGGVNAKNKATFMSSSRQYGQTVISLKPIEVAKHPSVEVEVEERGKLWKREVLVHEPLEHSIECGIMLKEEFEALKIVSIPMSSKNMDLTADGRREIFMVGLVPYVRHRQCRCADGWINVDGMARDLRGEWNQTYKAILAHCMEADDYSVLEGWMVDHPNPLQGYYAWKFPGKDSFKLAANAMAGVASSRLTKSGLAPKIYVPALDAMRRQQNCERFVQWNLDDQIRKLLGGKKNNSVENLVGDNDVSDYYDEVFDEESGMTYLEMARKMLAKAWVQSAKNARRELARNAEKNLGKMYKSKSGKVRNVDKSCTVNGARSAVLTESTIWIQIEAPGHELDQFGGIVDAMGMVEKFGELGFNFGGFAAEELENGFNHGLSEKLTKDDLERMLKSYMIRLNDLSIESVFMDGDSPWLNVREHLFPENVTVLARCINMDELSRLQNARQLVEDCGMDTSDVKQILSAYRKPALFRKMFFDGEVQRQTWAGLR